MFRMRAGAKTPEGLLQPTFVVYHGEGGAERTPIDTLGRRRPGESPVRKARERRRGEILAKADVADPRGGKPRGASSAGRVNHACCRQGLSGGRNPGTAVWRAGPRFGVGIPSGETVSGFSCSGNGQDPAGRRKLRRVNPTSAAGVKQNRPGIAGSKPPGG
jgi:hypothetical protein